MNRICGRAERLPTRARPAGLRRRSGVTPAIVGAVVSAVAFAVVGLGAASQHALARTSAVPALAGAWQPLPPAPIGDGGVPIGVRMGRAMFVFARVAKRPPEPWSKNAAALYTPATNSWRRLTPALGPEGNYEGSFVGAWTGKEVLVGGPGGNFAYNPKTNRWRRLPVALGGPLSVWTGREMISWGGGCCGDAFSTGSAYNPSTNTKRALPASPLAPAQRPIGAWTGRELIIVIGGLDPDGKAYPASFARAAAYNPTTNQWRRIARLPVAYGNPQAVWDGRRLLVVGAGTRGKATLAYNPTTNRWQARAAMPSRLGGPFAFARPVLWTGKRMMLWRGRDGLAYNPTTNRWTALPRWPFSAHGNVTLVWTGRALIVWGFRNSPTPLPGVGAAFTPAIP